MKPLVNSSFRLKTYFIGNTGGAIVGTISMDSVVNLGGELFFRSKVEGFRILEK